MATPSPVNKIQRGARHVRRIAYAAAGFAVMCVASELLVALAPLWKGGDKAAALHEALDQATLAAPALFFVWGLTRARRLFRRIEAGDVFAPDNSRDFVRVGWAVIGGAVWSLTLGGMVQPQSGVLAQELAGIGQGARDLALLALGLAVIVIGLVMAEARRLKVDNDSIL